MALVADLIGLAALVVVGLGLVYYGTSWVVGMSEARRDRRSRLRRRGRLLDAGFVDEPRLAEELVIYLLVPCLDEELVIGDTVATIVADTDATVVVIDDASDDATSAVAKAAGGERVLLLRRERPNARVGKGRALNAGFGLLCADVLEKELDPRKVVVGVMDADGRLSPGAIDEIRRRFLHPKVGGVQLGVRIWNRDSFLTRLQDFEFWGLSAVAQLARRRSGSVSLGGNGQFTRLEALLTLEDAPWSESLTEDLDLTITLLLAGWTLDTATNAHVAQHGVTSVRALVRQRTRWFQGHMTCATRAGEIWASSEVSNLAALEITCYLLVPTVLILPWSILFHVALWGMATSIIAGSGPAPFGNSPFGVAAAVFGRYLLAFWPMIVAGYLYARRDRGYARWRAIALGQTLVVANYVVFISCWWAALRIIRGRTNWNKTSRAPSGRSQAGAPEAPERQEDEQVRSLEPVEPAERAERAET